MTKKSKKQHKILKRVLIFCTLIIALVVLSGFSAFYVITSSSTLDVNKVVKSAPSVIFLSASGETINESLKAESAGVSSITKNAFIAKEDKRFYSHSGIDYIRVLGALKSNISQGGYAEGGSTITQQLIKNTHLSSDKTLTRKLKEMKLAKELEKKFTKEEILNAYLDTIYFGNGQTGITEASNYYFSKNASDLTLGESAILSGMISAPSVYNPVANLPLSKDKAKIVLSLMEEQGYITTEEKDNALVEIDNITISKNNKPNSLYMTMAEYEALEILGLEKFPDGASVVIKTYLDPDLQLVVQKSLESESTKAFSVGGTTPGIASLVLDNKTGGVLAFSGDCKHNLYSLKRQPASTIKPILVYGPAIEYRGLSPASFVLDEPININGYSPENATKKYYGLTTIRDNIVRSTNVPAVKVLNETGLEKSKKFASNAGIQFHENDNNLALALGGFTEGVTLKELATSYMAIANGGEFMPSGFVSQILVNGTHVYTHSTSRTRIMKKDTAYLLTDMLKSVAEYGTGRKINPLGINIASKTGTNYVDGCNHDGFNVSFTTKHTFLAWIGETGDPRPDNDDIYNGSTHPTYLIKNIAAWLYENNPPEDFKMPSSVTKVSLDQTEFSKGNLMLADEFSSGEVYELFSVNSLPPKRETVPYSEETITKYYSMPESPEFRLIYENMIRKYGSW